LAVSIAWGYTHLISVLSDLQKVRDPLSVIRANATAAYEYCPIRGLGRRPCQVIDSGLSLRSFFTNLPVLYPNPIPTATLDCFLFYIIPHPATIVRAPSASQLDAMALDPGDTLSSCSSIPPPYYANPEHPEDYQRIAEEGTKTLDKPAPGTAK
jgi:hypothetical protein